MLLGTEDGPGPGNSNPSYECLRGNLEMLHRITADKRTSPAEAGFTVNGKHALVPLTQLDEFV